MKYDDDDDVLHLNVVYPMLPLIEVANILQTNGDNSPVLTTLIRNHFKDIGILRGQKKTRFCRQQNIPANRWVCIGTDIILQSKLIIKNIGKLEILLCIYTQICMNICMNMCSTL